MTKPIAHNELEALIRGAAANSGLLMLSNDLLLATFIHSGEDDEGHVVSRIFGLLVGADGSIMPDSEPFLVAVEEGETAALASVAQLDDGRIAAAWTSAQGGMQVLKARALEIGGGDLGPVVTVAQDSSISDVSIRSSEAGFVVDYVRTGDGTDAIAESHEFGGAWPEPSIAENDKEISYTLIAGSEASPADDDEGGGFGPMGILDITINGGDASETIDARERIVGGVAYINGMGGNDIIYGTNFRDSIQGGSGYDILFGGDGNDTLDGGDNDDALVGGDGNDTLIGGAGSFDTAAYDSDGGTRVHDIRVNLGVGQMAVGYLYYPDALVPEWREVTLGSGQAVDTWGKIDTLSGIEKVIGGGGSDIISAQGSRNAFFTFIGGAGRDQLIGGDLADTLDGGAGKDSLVGGDGGDHIYGSMGFADGEVDTLYGGAGNDTLEGGAEDILTGGIGNDVLIGGIVVYDEAHGTLGWNIDLLAGLARQIESGEIDIYQNVANVMGGSGNDTMRGSAGNDTLRGGAGYDIVYASLGSDVLAGEEIRYTEVNAGSIKLNLATGRVEKTGGVDQISGFVNAYGTDFADTLTGSSVANVLLGGGGKDEIYGGGGDDFLAGQGGNDTIFGGTEGDRIFGDEGEDFLYGEDGLDTLDGGDNNDVLYGGNNSDTLLGGTGNDWLDAGNDLASDSIDGGTGFDTIIGSRGNDTIDGGLDGAHLDYSGLTGRIVLDLDLGTGTGGTVAKPDFSETDIIKNIWTATGTDFNDRLYGDNGAGGNILKGGRGNDTIDGRDGLDRLYGGDGNDSVLGGRDSDELYGEEGNDTLNGGTGADLMVGGNGDDIFYIDNRDDGAIELNGRDGGNDYAYISARNYDIRKLANIEGWESIEGGSVNLIADAPETIAGSVNAINENTTSETVGPVALIRAHDDGHGGDLDYRLVSDFGGLFRIEHEGTGASRFGKIILTRAVDFEALTESTTGVTIENGRKYYNLQVYAAEQDTAEGGLVSDNISTIRIEIRDVNERPSAPTLSGHTSIDAPENEVFASALIASDVDASTSLTYHFDPAFGANADANGMFVIDNGTRQLKLAGGETLNYETAPADASGNRYYKVYVRAFDGTDYGPTQELTINVVNVNDRPNAPVFTGGATTIATPENQPFFVQLTATDEDEPAGPITFRFDPTKGPAASANGLFTINSSGQLVLTDPSVPLDFEAMPIGGYKVYVQANDGSGAPNAYSLTQELTITVTDGRDTPLAPKWVDSNSSSTEILIAENSQTIPFRVRAVDPDEEQNTVTYAFVDRPGNHHSFFNINAAGEITLRPSAQLDYESTPVLTIFVQATDGDGPSPVQQLTIRLTPVDEAPIIMEAAGGSIVENTAGMVGYVYAEDPEHFAVTYQWADDVPLRIRELFDLDPESGAITVVSGLDYEADDGVIHRVNGETYYLLKIVARDQGTGALASDPVLIRFDVTNVNEEPTLQVVSGGIVNDNSLEGTIVADLLAEDPDGDSFSFIFVSPDGQDLGTTSPDSAFQIVGNQIVRTDADVAFVRGTDLEYRIKVIDEHGAATESTIIIHVNDAPVVGINNNLIREDQGSGHYVGMLTGTDPDAGDTVTQYFLDDSCADLFALKELGGSWYIMLNGSVDYENDPRLHELRDDQGEIVSKWYEIKVSAKDNHGLRSEPQILKIFIEDVQPDNSAPEILVAPGGTTFWEVNDTDTVAILRDISFFDAEDAEAGEPIFAGVNLDDITSGTLIMPTASEIATLFSDLVVTWDPSNPYSVWALGAQDRVTEFLKLVQFNPSNRPSGAGVYTSDFTIMVIDSQNAAATRTVTVAATATGEADNALPVIQVDPDHASTPTTDWALNPVNPFEFVTVSDANAADTLTVTVSFDLRDGTLGNAGQDGDVDGDTITYTYSGNAAAVNAWLQNLTFDATEQNAPGPDVTTRFTITVNDGHHGLPVTNSDVTVVTTVTGPQPDAAPSISGLTDEIAADANSGTVSPFAGVTISNEANQATTAAITFQTDPDNPHVLSGEGLELVSMVDGLATYRLTAATPADLADALAALTFNPRDLAAGASEDIEITVTVTDDAHTSGGTGQTGTVTVHSSAGGGTPTDAAPSITDIDEAVVADANSGTVQPFAGMTVTNEADQETTLVIAFERTLGTLGVVEGSGLVLPEPDPVTGAYTFTGTAAELNVILANLTFDPRDLAAGASEDIAFTVTVTDEGHPDADASRIGTVTVHSSADGEPQLNIAFSDATIRENAPRGSIIGQFTANTTSALTWTLVNDAEGRVELLADGTLVVKNQTMIDNELSGTFDVKVSVWDGHSTTEYTTTLTVLNLQRETVRGLTSEVEGVGIDDYLRGGSGNDTLIGSIGNDTLSGGNGADQLNGGAGDDAFRFDGPVTNLNRDTIVQFDLRTETSQGDRFELLQSRFSAITSEFVENGILKSEAFHLGNAATSADHRIIYDQTTGEIWYDRDGSGAIAANLIATITSAVKPTLTNEYFHII